MRRKGAYVRINTHARVQNSPNNGYMSLEEWTRIREEEDKTLTVRKMTDEERERFGLPKQAKKID